ncbi:hypothetical protein EDD29_0049 [Actinocorallia herbida]|uniref:Uncharacterized protein n=1 Tax=Actinocorallia herbida TaxID=58109 RepID=A0A3N1CMM8_9ACTN|nr:hypothetical protein [Actinocorallia herbida]ROO82569.1 hypothetical protein EDD29_0049 [Actinocorallia herbida]
MTNEQPNVEARLSDLHRLLEVGIERLAGQIGLLGQRLDQQDVRHLDHGQRLDRHDERLDVLDRTAVTREDLNEKSRRTIATLGLITSVLGIAVGALTSIIIAIVQ